jgi:putative aminophosphonate oxidoreductase
MTPPPHRSWWLREALTDRPARALEGSERADVAVIGGGFVGLWTALRLKELDPALSVVVLEADVCGGGASGRNGGMALSWWPKLPSLLKLMSTDEARELAQRSERAVAELGAFCERHGIDADYVPGGWLWTAATLAQLGAWEATMAACERVGVEPFARLTNDEVARRTGSPVHLAGVFEASAATVQPAKLVRGLRRVAIDSGVRVYEQSKVLDFTREWPHRLTLAAGSVQASKMVLATNAWGAAVPELRRSLVVVSSDMIVTEPLGERLADVGWTGGESITDSQMMVHYYRTTRDGRIAFGKGGWGIAFGGHITGSFDRHRGRAADVERNFRRLYPRLHDVAIAADWAGPIDRSHNGLPLLGRLPTSETILYGVGFSGNGVAPSWLAGRVLASLALDRRDEWSTIALVNAPAPRFPPPAITYAGAHLVRDAVVRKENAEALGRRPARLSSALASLAPSGLEDK